MIYSEHDRSVCYASQGTSGGNEQIKALDLGFIVEPTILRTFPLGRFLILSNTVKVALVV